MIKRITDFSFKERPKKPEPLIHGSHELVNTNEISREIARKIDYMTSLAGQVHFVRKSITGKNYYLTKEEVIFLIETLNQQQQ